MILKVDPGGWGADTARPASARTAPSRGRITAAPPIRAPSAAAVWAMRCGLIVVVSERPAAPGVRAITREPNDRRLAGRPARRES